MEALLAWVVERVAKFPCEHMLPVGDRLVETCLDITSHLVEASYRRDKHAELAAASRALVRARVVERGWPCRAWGEPGAGSRCDLIDPGTRTRFDQDEWRW